jgi:hypothetical protein
LWKRITTPFLSGGIPVYLTTEDGSSAALRPERVG